MRYINPRLTLRTMAKKVINFLRKKESAAPEKILATPVMKSTQIHLLFTIIVAKTKACKYNKQKNYEGGR